MSKRNIWIIILLVGGYVVCQAIADIGATKLVQIGNVVIPAGTFIFTVITNSNWFNKANCEIAAHLA